MISVTLPLKLPSTANLREHWATKAKRHANQRLYVRLRLQPHEECLWKADRLRCTLTRVGPRKLDDDNLASAFKAVRDEVAAVVGIDDGSDRWTWMYVQEKAKEYSVRIELEVVQ